MRYFLIALLPILFFINYSCNIDSKANIPTYIYIDTIGIKINKYIEGAATHKITDLWVYSDGKAVGVFNIKQLIPILATDYSHPKIQIFAGIRTNGSKSEVETYYLLDDILIEKELISGEIDTLSAMFQYEEETKFVFNEDFENGNIFAKDLDNDKKTKIINSTSDIVSGKYCGRIDLNEENSIIDVTSLQEYYDLPIDKGNKVYLELDYKNNVEFYIGLIGKEVNGSSHKVDIIYLNKKEKWNKIYINLTTTILNSSLNSYKIYFRAKHNTENETSTIQLDNIKLLYLGR
jgi:hypothetical protein